MVRLTSCLLLIGVIQQVAVAQDSIRESVVKIHTSQRVPDPERPWTKRSPQETSGTGAIIDGKRIITNAHVVLYASRILVQPNQSTERIPATIEAIAPGMDLAVLKLSNEAIFDSRPPLTFDEGLPKVKATVNAYGFPVGGEQLSVTEGIISRVEYVSYRNTETGMRIQVDAALNPGNSGGPAIADGKIVGLVFSIIPSADNIGFLIPAEEVRLFLDDVRDGKYQGKPKLLDDMQTVENVALRERLKLDAGTGGLMVTKPLSSEESYPLKEWDVITHIGDTPIDNEGNIKIDNELRMSFRYMLPKVVHDEVVDLTLWRDGQSVKVQVPVTYDNGYVIPFLSGEYPQHFICGPLVFSTAYQELVAAIQMRGQAAFAMRQSPLISRWFDRKRFPDEELVLLGPRVIPSPLLEGYDNPAFAVVTHVNDTEVRNLTHLVEMIRKAEGKFLTLRLGGGFETMVLNRQELIDSTEEILADEGIRNQMSPELEKIWNPN